MYCFNLWISGQPLKNRFHIKKQIFFILWNSKFCQYWTHISPWHWAAGPFHRAGISGRQFPPGPIHLFRSFTYLPGTRKHLSLEAWASSDSSLCCLVIKLNPFPGSNHSHLLYPVRFYWSSLHIVILRSFMQTCLFGGPGMRRRERQSSPTLRKPIV